MGTIETSRTKYLQELLDEKDGEDRGRWLQMRQVPQRLQVLGEWAADPDLRASDIVALPPPFNVLLQQLVCGAPSKGIAGTGRIFYLRPNPDWAPPRRLEPDTRQALLSSHPTLDNGWKGRKGKERRQTIAIDRPMAFPADRAICAMDIYGPDSGHPMNEGRLLEMSLDEYADWRSGVDRTKEREALADERAKREVAESDRDAMLARLEKLEAMAAAKPEGKGKSKR